MAKEYSRRDRVAEMMQRELAQLIQQELGDPRIGMVTVSHVEVTADLKYAKVFITRLNGFDSAAEIADCLAGLSHAAGFLRRALSKRIQLRVMPELRFLHDESLERGFRMDALIAQAVASSSNNDES